MAVDVSGTQRWYSSYLAWATKPMLPTLGVGTHVGACFEHGTIRLLLPGRRKMYQYRQYK